MSRSLVARTYPCTPTAIPPMTTNLTSASRSASSSSSAWNIARRALLQFAHELAQAKCLLEPILGCLRAISPSPDRARPFLAGPLLRCPGRRVADRHRANHGSRCGRWFGFGELDALALREGPGRARVPAAPRRWSCLAPSPSATSSAALTSAGSRVGEIGPSPDGRAGSTVQRADRRSRPRIRPSPPLDETTRIVMPATGARPC